MADMQEYIGDYLTVTHLTVGAVAAVLCCGTGLVCLRMMVNNADADVTPPSSIVHRPVPSDMVIEL